MASSLRTGFLDFPSPSTKPVESPSTPVLRRSATDEEIWERLKDAGFDEESIKRRDKAALIAYITKVETELHEHQHHMGLLLLERKESAAKFEQVKNAADSAESTHKRAEASHATALAEARKREENLKRALGIEKECVANLEKALHEVRKESAGVKLASEAELTEAKKILEDVEKKYIESDMKQHTAEILKEEASRFHSAAERKFKEIEAREDDIRRRFNALQFEFDAKEKEISSERQCLSARKSALQQEEESLVQRQKILNEREEYVFQRSQHLEKLEKELNKGKTNINTKFAALEEEKSNLEMKLHSLEAREEAVIRREAHVCKKEQELLILKEKLLSKECDEIQKLAAEHQAGLEVKRSDFEAELIVKQKQMDDEIEAKRQALGLWEENLKEKEEQVETRIHEIEKRLFELMEQQKSNDERALVLEEREQRAHAAQEAADIDKMCTQREREELIQMNHDLMKRKESLESEMKLVLEAQQKLELTKNEREELRALQIKLKDEIDSFRVQKLELAAKEEELKAEKEKFEAKWQLIDEKKEELRQEAERISEEREALSRFLEDERESRVMEKDHLRKQFKEDEEALLREREDFISKMKSEHSEWLINIQRERKSLYQDVQLQKLALENLAYKRQEEIEAYLREQEEAFEVKKMKELEIIGSQKELAAKELEHVSQELKRIEDERTLIALDREEREKEWAAIRSSIQELQVQREKLQEQRVLLHKEREEIQSQVQRLSVFEEMNVTSKNIVSSEMQRPAKGLSEAQELPLKRHSIAALFEVDDVKQVGESFISTESPTGSSLLVSTPLSWVKKCAQMVFRHSPEKTDGEDKSYNNGDSNGKQGEEKGILEFPSAKELNNVELGCTRTKDKSNASIHNNSKRKLNSFKDSSKVSLGIKKRNTYSSSHDLVDSSSQNYKKRREDEDASEFQVEGKTSNCLVSTQPQNAEDHYGLNLSNRSLGKGNKEDCFADVQNKKPEASFVSDRQRDPPLVENGEHLEDARTRKQDSLDEKTTSAFVGEIYNELNPATDAKSEKVYGEEEEEEMSVKEKLWEFLVT
ncbi:nuclear matrix constituent protein 1b [Aristolochia californica]|uniref:nuclear matrix constituent protein 1b n=1 Tax=Aristolochia californica TaxID=171875 RepID=UPI0035E308DE